MEQNKLQKKTLVYNMRAGIRLSDQSKAKWDNE